MAGARVIRRRRTFLNPAATEEQVQRAYKMGYETGTIERLRKQDLPPPWPRSMMPELRGLVFPGGAGSADWLPLEVVDAYKEGYRIARRGRALNRGRRNAGASDEDRERLRLKQEFLIMLAVDHAGYPESYRIAEHVGAPTLSQIREYIYPEWEHAIDYQIHELARDQRIGLPDFDILTQRTLIRPVR